MNKFFFFLFFIAFNISAQNSSLDVISNSRENSHLFFTTADVGFRKIENRGELFTEIHVDGFSKSYDIGNPDLPVFSKLIEIPSGGDISISIINKSETYIDLTDIGFSDKLMPSQRSISKSEDPTVVDFNFNEKVYTTDDFYANELISVERLGTMRERTLARIQISPFAYHPLTHSVKLVDDLEFKVEVRPYARPWSTDQLEICHLRVRFGRKDQKGSSIWEWSRTDGPPGEGAWKKGCLTCKIPAAQISLCR